MKKVKVKLIGSKATFIIDTGAGENVLSRSFGESVELKPLPCAEMIRNFEGKSAPEVKIVHEIAVTLGKQIYALESFRVTPRTTEDVVLGIPILALCLVSNGRPRMTSSVVRGITLKLCRA